MGFLLLQFVYYAVVCFFFSHFRGFVQAFQLDRAVEWFRDLQKQICDTFQVIESNYGNTSPHLISEREWARPGGGGGLAKIFKGLVFEKAGVNFSHVHGSLPKELFDQLPGASASGGQFVASGLSVVAHMNSPIIPAIHMNTRIISTSFSWFGGGIDMTPYEEIDGMSEDFNKFHNKLEGVCQKYDKNCYEKFKNDCDKYFFLPHRNEPRGIGGIFFDNLPSDDNSNTFQFVKNVGEAFIDIYSDIIRKYMYTQWSQEQKEKQLRKRGRYVEFNLLYDRGTRFGILTKGNPDSVLMSMPPTVKWD